MHAFIDESGDAGFKLNAGSSSLFIMCMVCFGSTEAAQYAEKDIARAAQSSGHKSEFKFTACRDVVKEEFFKHAINADFTVQAIVVDKKTVRSQRWKSESERFYRHVLQALLSKAQPPLQDAELVIDGEASREHRIALRTAIRSLLPIGAVSSVRLKNSTNDRLLQLADMCAGAIHRAERNDDRRNLKWFETFKPKIARIDRI